MRTLHRLSLMTILLLILSMVGGCATFADSFKAAAVEAARTASEKGLEMGRDLAAGVHVHAE